MALLCSWCAICADERAKAARWLTPCPASRKTYPFVFDNGLIALIGGFARMQLLMAGVLDFGSPATAPTQTGFLNH
jgi:hypothetical protein